VSERRCESRDAPVGGGPAAILALARGLPNADAARDAGVDRPSRSTTSGWELTSTHRATWPAHQPPTKRITSRLTGSSSRASPHISRPSSAVEAAVARGSRHAVMTRSATPALVATRPRQLHSQRPSGWRFVGKTRTRVAGFPRSRHDQPRDATGTMEPASRPRGEGATWAASRPVDGAEVGALGRKRGRLARAFTDDADPLVRDVACPPRRGPDVGLREGRGARSMPGDRQRREER
jgi:hypothetical protein